MTSSTTTALPQGLTTGTWTIDPSHSEASFTVRHAGISKVRGTVAIASGELVLGETLADSTLTATLDPATVSTGDANRDGHLKSGDFFDVEKFGQWTFVSTEIRQAGGSTYEIAGDLTIHGVTQHVEIATEFNGTATDPFGNLRAGAEATTTISRKDFGLTWNAALEAGGVLVADKVRIDLDVSVIKQA